jgi:hypothetical protein
MIDPDFINTRVDFIYRGVKSDREPGKRPCGYYAPKRGGACFLKPSGCGARWDNGKCKTEGLF